MEEPQTFKLETLQCATSAAGDEVSIAFSGSGYAHGYVLPIRRLGRLIEELLKLHNTARANGVIGKAGEQPSRIVPKGALETFLVDDVTVVFSDAGPVTMRIVCRDGSRDIVFQPQQWEFLRSPRATAAPEGRNATH